MVVSELFLNCVNLKYNCDWWVKIVLAAMCSTLTFHGTLRNMYIEWEERAGQGEDNLYSFTTLEKIGQPGALPDG